ncbi:hypothetical protein PENTCL1PPCAC_15919, partial [Pristionchus entomophagus]
MEQLGIFLDKNITSKYSPIFEIVHSIELILVNFGILLSFPLIWIVWNAEPLHRNLRIIFALAILESLAIFVTRPSLIYVQYCVNCLKKIFRMAGISLERLIATFHWEWYEQQGTGTLNVVVGIFFTIFLLVAWNTLHIIGVLQTDSGMI